jgi:nitroreductase
VPTVSREVISAVVEAGIRAPSGDNCQPWRFRWDGEYLRILFLADRAESLYDIRSVASWISLGAVITNMTLVALRLGFRPAVDLFRVGEAADVVARVRFDEAPVEVDLLVEAISARTVNRRPYLRKPLPMGVREELQALAASSPGTRLSWIDTDPSKGRVAALAAQNDRILFENRALHDGLYRWIRWTRSEVERRRDGMPAEALELAAFERPGMRLLGSWRWARISAALGLTRILPLRARTIYGRSAAMALLSMRGDQPEDFVRGGQILERIWLTATRHGVAFQPITGITFLLLRRRLTGGEGLSAHHRMLLDRVENELKQEYPEGAAETPIMLFRVGLAPPPSGRAPRLSLEQVFEIILPAR